MSEPCPHKRSLPHLPCPHRGCHAGTTEEVVVTYGDDGHAVQLRRYEGPVYSHEDLRTVVFHVAAWGLA